MNPSLYYPCFAMFLLTLGVLVVMFVRRVNALKSKTVKMNYFKTYHQNEEGFPEKMLQASRNFANLFEVPTLFYMVCLFATVLNSVDTFLVILSWSYVVFRLIHSFIHLNSNNIRLRMSLYALSWLVLILMAFWLFYKLISLNFS